MKPREVRRRLSDAGFELARQRGSHQVWKHPDGRWTVVPDHRGDLAPGTLREIEKQTGVELLPRPDAPKGEQGEQGEEE